MLPASGSLALIGRLTGSPTLPVWVPGLVTLGARLVLATVMLIVSLSEALPSLTVTVSE